MTTTTIFNLPTELLQNIFEYLDWDRSEHLEPTRPDIFNISLVCKPFHEAVIPILFRNVSLKLRWVNGALAEPKLLRLRQECPHLTKYMRCVYVQTFFGHFRDSGARMKPFSIPTELQSWLDSTVATSKAVSIRNGGTAISEGQASLTAEKLRGTPQCEKLLESSPSDVQERFSSLAQTISADTLADTPLGWSPEFITSLGEETFFDDGRESPSTPGSPQASLLASRRDKRDLRFRLDALFLTMLCFPPRLTSLVFESMPGDRADTLQNRFALQLAVLTIKLYGGHLKQLTVKSSSQVGGVVARPSDGRRNDPKHTLSDAVTGLDVIKELSISGHHDLFDPRSSAPPHETLDYWHTIADRITFLDLRHISGDIGGFMDFIVKFTGLEHLALSQITVHYSTQVPAPRPRGRTSPTAVNWLQLLIELRRKLPNVKFSVPRMKLAPEARSNISIPRSGVRWLLQEAVPKGCKVDFERETRLAEDFESFIYLWNMEDGEGGTRALEESRSGKLVDQALSSRWKGLR